MAEIGRSAGKAVRDGGLVAALRDALERWLHGIPSARQNRWELLRQQLTRGER